MYNQKYPIPLSEILDFCWPAQKLHEDISRGYEYGLSWHEYVHNFSDEWLSLAEKWWEELPLQDKVMHITRHLAYARSSVEHYEEWLKSNGV